MHTHTHFSADGRTDVTCGESRQDNTIQGCPHKKKKKKHLDYSSSAVQNHRRQGREGGRVGEEVEVIGEEAAASFWLCQYGATVNSEQVFVFVLQEKKKKKMRGCIHPSTGSPETRKHPEEAFSEELGEWEGGGMRWLEESKIGAPGALIMEAGKDSVPSTNPKAALFLGKL